MYFKARFRGEIILSDLLCSTPPNSMCVSVCVYMHFCTPVCCCGRRVDVSLIMWRRNAECQGCADGVKAGLLQCHGLPAVCAHRQGAKIKDAWYVECWMLKKPHTSSSHWRTALMLRFLSRCCAQETFTNEKEVEMLKPPVAWLDIVKHILYQNWVSLKASIKIWVKI